MGGGGGRKGKINFKVIVKIYALKMCSAENINVTVIRFDIALSLINAILPPLHALSIS